LQDRAARVDHQTQSQMLVAGLTLFGMIAVLALS
jgi:hypothetical protein